MSQQFRSGATENPICLCRATSTPRMARCGSLVRLTPLRGLWSDRRRRLEASRDGVSRTVDRRRRTTYDELRVCEQHVRVEFERELLGVLGPIDRPLGL